MRALSAWAGRLSLCVVRGRQDTSAEVNALRFRDSPAKATGGASDFSAVPSFSWHSEHLPAVALVPISIDEQFTTWYAPGLPGGCAMVALWHQRYGPASHVTRDTPRLLALPVSPARM